ncbi:hypothetical protein AYO38_01565 [bacterium SCGC AG-212-C10]|nr:hypothetical protein AYO38_01565 [bacterium SCGC AG-212-C10]
MDNGELHAAHLAEGSTFIGRGEDATVRVNPADRTVSRLHAQLRLNGKSATLEHLSSTNATRVRGEEIRNTELRDGDAIQLGTFNLSFHDLARTRLLSGIVCGNCQRENEASGKDCWYCGQNLVNAPSVVLKNRSAACRLVSASGGAKTLFAGHFVAIYSNGSMGDGRGHAAPPEAVVTILGREDNSAVISSRGVPVAINGAQLSGEHALQDGDRISCAGQQFIALLR